MKRILTSLAAAAALSSISLPSYAQDGFATQGTFAFGVERAFGIYIGTRTTEWPNFERKHDFTRMTFLIGSSSGETDGFSEAPMPYHSPRVGFDYFVIDGLSLGGSIAAWSYDDEADVDRFQPADRVGREDFERSGFLFSPRVGYAIMFSDVIGIWPRGGLTFWTDSADDRLDPWGDHDSNEFALTLEFHLIISPVEHLGITVGPVLDFGFAGEIDRPDPDDADPDLSTTSFGIAVAGLFGWI